MTAPGFAVYLFFFSVSFRLEFLLHFLFLHLKLHVVFCCFHFYVYFVFVFVGICFFTEWLMLHGSRHGLGLWFGLVLLCLISFLLLSFFSVCFLHLFLFLY